MSSVILSGLPYPCNDSDIHRALLMYGTAVSVQLDPARQLAVVTMRTSVEAQALLNRRTVQVLGAPVRIDPATAPMPVATPAPAGGSYYSGGAVASGAPVVSPLPQPHAPVAVAAPGPNPSSLLESLMPAPRSSRLGIFVEDCRFPITREVLEQMFNMIDKPLSITCSESGLTTAGSVEFASVQSAETAMTRFNGKNIYPGCCLLHLSYLPTRDPQPTTTPVAPASAAAAYLMGGAGTFAPPAPAPAPAPPVPPVPNYAAPIPPHTPHSYHDTPDRPYHAMEGRGVGVGGRGGVRGGRGGVHGLRDSTNGAMRGAFDPMHAPTTYGSQRGGRGGVGAAPLARGRGAIVLEPGEEPILAVHNVNESVPLYSLWVLLEVYGNVYWLQRQKNCRTTVIGKFQRTLDAKSAAFHLQDCPLRGNRLRLNLVRGYEEKNNDVDWSPGPPTDPATQAFVFSVGYHHRMKPHIIYAPVKRLFPSRDLFLSNLIDEITDADIERVFREAKRPIVEIGSRQMKSAILHFTDVEAAVEALMAMHGKEVGGRFLNLTFSFRPPASADGREEDEGNKEVRGGAVELTYRPDLN